MEVIKSNNGGNKICWIGYTYIKQITWRCSKEHSLKCSGTMYTDLELGHPQIGKVHSHIADNHETNPAEIYTENVETLDPESQAKVPSIMKRTILNQRKTNHPASETNIVREWCTTGNPDNKRLLLVDDGDDDDEDRIVIFASDEGLQNLSKSSEWYMDEGSSTNNNPDSSQPGPSFTSPRKTYKRKKYATELDNFDNEIVRRIVHEFYERGEYPTSKKILNAAQQKFNYNGSLASMKRLLIKLKFSYKKSNDGRKFLMERNDIVALRCKFLRTMSTLRKNNDPRPVVYLDETWMNQNHSRSHIWQNKENTEGFKVPTGKSGRLIVCHAGSKSHGFIEGAKMIFRSKSEMLQSLEEACVIVMDNAAYHSILETVAELRERVKLLLSTQKKYELDELALKMGHEVVRLPPYHCQYNPIEMIWAQVKRQVATKNTTFKIADVEKLMHEAINSVTKEDWINCVRHTEKIQEEDY
ncbi:DDE 3 domain-containing protein [Aphis craccivora]|uniref:DDE 3 domain-containing protein n=1 Tax=Aphis craccivora TaxID=307492 RepID=A0A6G0YPH0_APHCR|nr:DDE 3 domain-containing protein [Aphis craccivora]